MKPFVLYNASSVSDAATQLAKGKAAVLAGGTDLLTTMKSMCTPAAAFDTLVNVKTIPNLDYIKEEGGMLKIGANARLTTIARSDVVKSKYTALAEAAAKVASPQIRNMGTIAGNISQQNRCWYFRADGNNYPCLRNESTNACYALTGDNRYHSIFGPTNSCFTVNCSDIAPVLAAFGAKIITNKKSAGWTTAEFFVPTGEHQHAMAADEIITEIQIPTPAAGTKSSFQKFALRKAFDFPIVNCAAVVTSSGGNVTAASVVLNAVHGAPRVVAISGLPTAHNDAFADSVAAAAVNGNIPMPVNNSVVQTATGNQYMVQIARTMARRAVIATR